MPRGTRARFAVRPFVWRLVGFVSTLVGLICNALSPPFNNLFQYGELSLIAVIIYCVLGSLVCTMMLCVTSLKLTESSVSKAQVVFFVLMVTSVCSFYQDKSEEGKGENESGKVLNLISCGAFALMSLCLSKLTDLGFELGITNFFLGCVMMAVMKWSVRFALLAAVLCYILISIRTYSDTQLETIQSTDIEEPEHLLMEHASSSNEPPPGPIPQETIQSSDIEEPVHLLIEHASSSNKRLSIPLSYVQIPPIWFVIRESLRLYVKILGNEKQPTVV